MWVKLTSPERLDKVRARRITIPEGGHVVKFKSASSLVVCVKQQDAMRDVEKAQRQNDGYVFYF